MSTTLWHTENCGDGRQYMLGHETAEVKYPDQAAIIQKIEEGIRPHLFAEPAIRLTLDAEAADPERVILSIPCDSDQDLIIQNFAQSIYTSIMGYYASAEPRTSHFGISHSILDGQFNSLLRREIERHFSQIQSRPEMAARVLEGVGIQAQVPNINKEQNQLSETLSKGLNIYVGYRIHAFGELINNAQMFVPMQGGEEIIELVYSNIEQLISQNFLSYDESGDKYLEISDTLIFKELASILQRSRLKENTRKKILNHLGGNQFFLSTDQPQEGSVHGDSLYDTLNNVQEVKLQAAALASSKLYASVVVKSAAMAPTEVGTKNAKLPPSAGKSKKAKAIESDGEGSTIVPSAADTKKAKSTPKKTKASKPVEEGLEELAKKN